MRERPFVLLGVAFALGVLGGYLVPMSETERRRFGPVRDRLLDRARVTATDAVKSGKQVLRDVVRGA